MKNKYLKRAHINERKFRELLKFFAEDFTVTQIAKFIGLTRANTHNIFQKVRHIIHELSLKENPLFVGDVEVDESYFVARRVRGRGAKGKIKVFGLLKRNDFVYTQIVDVVSAKTLQGIIRGKVEFNSVIHTDAWKTYNGLVDLGYEALQTHS